MSVISPYEPSPFPPCHAAYNPWHLAAGDACYRILLEYNNRHYLPHAGPSQTYAAIIAVPVAVAAYHPDPLEGAATQAWRWATEHDGLLATQMAYCTFYCRLHNTGQWLPFR